VSLLPKPLGQRCTVVLVAPAGGGQQEPGGDTPRYLRVPIADPDGSDASRETSMDTSTDASGEPPARPRTSYPTTSRLPSTSLPWRANRARLEAGSSSALPRIANSESANARVVRADVVQMWCRTRQ